MTSASDITAAARTWRTAAAATDRAAEHHAAICEREEVGEHIHPDTWHGDDDSRIESAEAEADAARKLLALLGWTADAPENLRAVDAAFPSGRPRELAAVVDMDGLPVRVEHDAGNGAGVLFTGRTLALFDMGDDDSRDALTRLHTALGELLAAPRPGDLS